MRRGAFHCGSELMWKPTPTPMQRLGESESGRKWRRDGGHQMVVVREKIEAL